MQIPALHGDPIRHHFFNKRPLFYSFDLHIANLCDLVAHIHSFKNQPIFLLKLSEFYSL